MCGLMGIIAGHLDHPRSDAEVEALADTFTRLTLLSEHRGPHATGAAWFKQDGEHACVKEPLAARRFITSPAYLHWLVAIDAATCYLMGHTRWPSKGSVTNPANNHPILVGLDGGYRLALTHNGTIYDSDAHFARLGLTPQTQVDSELLARLAAQATDADGLDVGAYLDALYPLDGSLSLALTASSHPERVLLVKGNMPLAVRAHHARRLLAYASEATIVDRALAGQPGWEPLPLQYGEALWLDSAAWTLQRWEFTFTGMCQMTAAASVTGQWRR